MRTSPSISVFEEAQLADHFPHHAGHGLGLAHPEAPYIVRTANETLMEGDVITLEPGPNIIDVVATNNDGQVLSTVIALIYRP